MEGTITEFIEQFGYLAVVLLICVENIFPPIPSEIILAFSGFMTTRSDMMIGGVIFCATAGSMIGAEMLYFLGRKLGKERIKRLFAGRFGKIMHFKPENVDSAEKWFSKYQYKAVFFCRCVPVVRSLISIPAGIAQMNHTAFFALTLLGSSVWNTVLVWLGALAGDAWEASLKHFSEYMDIALIVLAAVAAVAVIIHKRRSKSTKKDG
jgi:membrane protein DedA with SNARE-associated domain